MYTPPWDTELLTPREVAKLLRWSPRTVRRLASAGKLVAYKLPGPQATRTHQQSRLLITVESIQRYLQGDMYARGPRQVPVPQRLERAVAELEIGENTPGDS